jgi:hypothetical protein
MHCRKTKKRRQTRKKNQMRRTMLKIPIPTNNRRAIAKLMSLKSKEVCSELIFPV